MNHVTPSLIRSSAHTAAAAALSLAGLSVSLPPSAQYAQTNLVSNIPGLATVTEPRLVNPWGLSRNGSLSSR